MARLDDLQQVAPALGGEALQPPVVEDQQGDLGEAVHQTVVCAFVAGTGERRDQFGDAAVRNWDDCLMKSRRRVSKVRMACSGLGMGRGPDPLGALDRGPPKAPLDSW